ncbi:MAG: phage holin family protein [Candidatus Omnitrophota bacterium]|jgi:putative membrane protein
MLVIIRLTLNVISLVLAAQLCPGISITNWQAALVAALVLGLFNLFLKPVLVFLTLPINLLSFGVFIFFINGLLFYAASRVVTGFHVDGYGSALLGAFFYSAINLLMGIFFNNRGGNNGGGPRKGRGRRSDVIDVEAKIES